MGTIYRGYILYIPWTHGEDSLKEFIKYLNEYHEIIKFTAEYSFREINYLDTKVKIDAVGTDLYVKDTDKSNYLHYKSAHPKHCKVGIPYGQFTRISRICTNDADFIRNSKNKANHFMRRDYPKTIVQEAYRRRVHDRKSYKKSENVEKIRNNEEIFLITSYRPGYTLPQETTIKKLGIDKKIKVNYSAV